VYGLFNDDCQIFIGESENIQEALLRHEGETDFQSRHLQPTGFTFEPCVAELRKPKADELIARFRPVLQTEPALTESFSPSEDSTASWVSLGGQQSETNADQQEFPVHERDERPKVRPRFYFKGKRNAALAAIVVASAAAVFYLGIPASQNMGAGVSDAGKKLLTRISLTRAPASGEGGIDLRPRNNSSTETAKGLAKQRAQPTKSVVHASASNPNRVVPPAAKSASKEGGTGVQAIAKPATPKPMTHIAESGNLSKKWSVQISSVPAKDIADTLVERLKAKGYDGYVVQANVKGQTYYRVRVGHFDARADAESVRQSLARQEGYRDAYLAGD
jgi:cell division septation protein DedD